MHLESIFMSSEDIRKQLPEDAERFDQIDRDFKVFLSHVISDRNNVLPFKSLRYCFFIVADAHRTNV